MNKWFILSIFVILLTSVLVKNSYPDTNPCINEDFIDAVTKGDLQKVGELIVSGADVNAKNDKGKTALMIASEKGYIDVVKFLIEYKTDLNTGDKYGQTALMFIFFDCIKDKYRFNFIRKDDVDKNKVAAEARALMNRFDKYHFDIVKLFIDNNADVNAISNDGWTALMFASDLGNPCLVKLLIENKADVNVKGCGA